MSIKSILNSHIANTVSQAHSQAQSCEAVLAIQNTADLNFTSHPATGKLGYLNQTKQQGIKLHKTVLLSSAGKPLGLLISQTQTSPHSNYPQCHPDRSQHPKTAVNPSVGDSSRVLPIDSFEQARRCGRSYSYRWLIERFHYVLKSGCQIEALQ